MMPSTTFQKRPGDQQKQKRDEDERGSLVRRCGPACLVSGRDAFERALGGLPFGAVRRQRHDLLPFRSGGLEIPLAEREDDAFVEQRLRMLGI